MFGFGVFILIVLVGFGSAAVGSALSGWYLYHKHQKYFDKYMEREEWKNR